MHDAWGQSQSLKKKVETNKLEHMLCARKTFVFREGSSRSGLLFENSHTFKIDVVLDDFEQ